MDPLTHSLLGAAIAKTGPFRARPMATMTLVLAANSADVDGLTYLADADLALGFRRGWTHGPVGLVVLPLVVTALVVAWGRFRSRNRAELPRPGWKSTLLLSYVGAASHPLLDWLNTYGVRFLMPFDGTWFYGDAVFIVDPWIWLLLGGAVFLAPSSGRRRTVGWTVLAVSTTALMLVALPAELWLARGLWCLALVGIAGLALRFRSAPEIFRSVASISLGLFVVYCLAMVGLSRGARTHVFASLAPELRESSSVMVGPRLATPFTKEVVVRTPNGYRVGEFEWLGARRFEPSDESWRLPEGSPAVEAALADPCIRGFVGWARFPVVRVQKVGDGFDVELFDLRYARQGRASFGSASVHLDRDLAPVPAPVGDGRPKSK